MAPKSLALAALLLLIAAAGHVPRCAGLGTSPNNCTVLISGIVPCSIGNAINMVAVPAFPNAGLQLVCGSNVMASTITDGNGAFLFSLAGGGPNLLTAFLGDQCKVVVITPLGACDKSLVAATGTLTAPLKLLGFDTSGGSGSGSGILGLGGLIGLVSQIISGLISGVVVLGTQPFSLV